jgi:AAA domain/MarR family
MMAYNLTVSDVAHRLGGARPGPDGSFYCRCPAHSDKKASLWIKERSGGGLFVKCHASCSRENVEAALQSGGLWPTTGARKRDNRDERKRVKEGDKLDAVVMPVPPDAPEIDWSALGRSAPNRLHEYHDADGQLTGYVARWTPLVGQKEIRPLSYARLKNGKHEWVMRGPSGPYDLYNLPELSGRPEAPVLIVEGEKAADAAKDLFPGHIAMAWRGGAGSAGKTDFTPLRGRRVVLWPDADEAGEKAMAEVATILSKIGAAAVMLVTPPVGVPKGWDVADREPEGVSVTEILRSAAPFATAARDADDGALAPVKPQDFPQAEPGLRPFVVSAADLMNLALPTRDLIVDPFLATSSMSMIYGPRGGGKTWVGLTLADSIARGENFLAYKVERPWTVLLIDGEMAYAELQARIKAIDPSPPPNFLVLPSETLFQESRPLNLHDAEDQAAIEALIEQLTAEGKRPDVIILDNLSSLSGGVDENDNSALDQLLRWMIKLRHAGLALVLVHHAGKNGTQRGASRREDLLDTSISLHPPPEDASPHHGAHVVLRFAKTRGLKPDPEELELRLSQNHDRLGWQFNKPMAVDRAAELLRMIWERRPKTQSELAAMSGVTDGAISHQVKKLRKDGYLSDGSPPTVTPFGRERLVEIWPELEAKIAQQGELRMGDVI